MKKIKFLITLIIIMFPIITKAESLTLKLECPKLASPNQTINCNLSYESQEIIKGLQLKYYLDNGITYNNLSLNKNWTNYYQNKTGLIITNQNLTTTEKNIATISFKIDKNITINKEYNIILKDIEASDNNHNLVTIPDITSTIKIVSNDNTLSNLSLNNGKISPEFNNNITNYTATINKNTTTITATPTNVDSKVTGNIGTNKLEYGANYFKITVTSPLGTTKDYNITIIRPLPSNNNLASEQENNTKTNNEQKSNDASLKDISISNYNLNFKSTLYNYSLKVSNNINNLEVKATANNSNSKITITGQNNLKIGENIITITVTAEDGTTCQYIITVTKLEKELSSDKQVNNIIIENYDLKFQEDKYNYNLTIKNEDKLNIKIELNSKEASYKITGNKNLKNNSIITITVTAEDTTSQTYTIKISKDSSSSINLDNIIFLSITIIIILLLLTILVKKKRTKRFNNN